MNRFSRFLIPLACMLMVSIPVFAGGSGETKSTSAKTLRQLADSKGIFIGAAVRPEYFEDEAYVKTLKENFNYLSPENDMKMESLRLSRTKFDYSTADMIIDFAVENKMQVRGHTLVWHNQLPLWLKSDVADTAEDWEAVLKDHITTVVSYYKGKIRDWDVVNEVVGDDGKYRDTVWSQHIPDYIAKSFKWARESDPNARLFINDYSAEEMGVKSDLLYALVKDLKSKGVPIDGVGFQCHFDGTYVPNYQSIAQNFKRFKDLGLECQITELDVRLAKTADADLVRQGQIYAEMLQTLVDNGNKTYIIWGVTDLHSWVPGFFPGTSAALLFNESYTAKPAVKSLWDKLVSLK